MHYLLAIASPLLLLFLCTACSEPAATSAQRSTGSTFSGERGEIRIMAVNPGHFHAALVQKTMLDQVDSTVYVYAPEGRDLELHLERIEGFNTRDEDPTRWVTEIYTGSDYFERMLEERPGNVMVTAGNNRLKTEYIKRAVEEGINVLSDKPMAINSEGWEQLVAAFEAADQQDVLLYDIMTERYEVTAALQRRLAQDPDLFGALVKGSRDDPAIIRTSVHHLYKTVAGAPLRRPPWYFDVEQQGEGIVDVTTHLVDLTMWTAFPDEAIDYQRDVQLLGAKRWPTMVTEEQFERITTEEVFPTYLQNHVEDDVLPLYANGEIEYALNGHHVRVSVEWDYEAQPGAGDRHYSVMRGTRSDLVIRQGEEEGFKSVLYIEPASQVDRDETEAALREAIARLQSEYPGLAYAAVENGWKLDIPEEHRTGHEAHFGQVADAYFGYLMAGELPHWEVPNMIAKYFITTRAREIALNRP